MLQQIANGAFAEHRRTKRFQSLGFGWVATYLLLLLLLLLLPLATAFLNDSGLSPDRLDDQTALIEVKSCLAKDAPATTQRIIAGLLDAFEA